jgi:hypothetical protein
MAARLYATGVAATKKEASVLAGLHPNYLTLLTRPNGGSEQVKRIVTEISKMIEDKAIDESVIIRKLGREALGRIAELMVSPNDHVSLKAAQDLADRSPHTAKTQRFEVDAFTLSGQDVKALAAALVESARPSDLRDKVALEGLVEIADLPQPEVPEVSDGKT